MIILTKYLLSVLLILPVSLSQRSCYFSDGTIADGYSACNNNTAHSGCCRLYQTNGTPVDLCTTNGLCLGRSGVWNGFFFQSGCTDPTWQSNNCPKACPGTFYPIQPPQNSPDSKDKLKLIKDSTGFATIKCCPAL
jgi:hypothetical protein